MSKSIQSSTELAELIRDVIGAAATGTSEIDVTADDAGNAFTFALKTGSISEGKLASAVQTKLNAGIDNLSTVHSNSLSTAFSNLGTSTLKTLTIDSNPVEVTSNLTLGENITLDIRDGAQISVASGVTLTIKRMRDPGSIQCFTGAGKVVIGDAVPEINLAWWHGTQSGISADYALGNAVYSMAQSGACKRLFVPALSVTTTGGLTLTPDMLVRGAGRMRTTIKKTGAGGYIFKVGGLTDDVVVCDMRLDGTGASGARGIVLESVSAVSGAGQTSRFIGARNVRFDSLDVGLDLKSLDSGGWELLPITVDNCYWVNCAKGARVNTVNSGVSFHNCSWYLPAGGYGIYSESVGSIKVYGNGYVFGSQTIVAHVPPTDGSTFIYAENVRNLISVTGMQEENCQYFFRNGTASYYAGIIAFRENLVQATILLKGGANVYTYDNTFVSYGKSGDDSDVGTFRDESGGSISFVHSDGDKVENRRYGTGEPIGTQYLAHFTNGSQIMRERSHDKYEGVSRLPQTFDLSNAFDGQGKMPVTMMNEDVIDKGASYATANGGASRRYLTPLLQLAKKSSGAPAQWFTFYRNATDGWLEIHGSQGASNRGLRSNGGFEALGYGTGIYLTSGNGSRYFLTVTDGGTLNIASAPAS